MHCPRCDGSLATFAVEATGKSAIVCESCGFAGVAASHHPEERDVESWERAIQRFEETAVSLDRLTTTDRTASVSIPTDDSGPEVDPEQFEESVTVAAALGEDSESEESESDTDTDSEESESDAPESDVAGAATDDSIPEN